MQIRFVSSMNRGAVCLGKHFCPGYQQLILQVKVGAAAKCVGKYYGADS